VQRTCDLICTLEQAKDTPFARRAISGGDDLADGCLKRALVNAVAATSSLGAVEIPELGESLQHLGEIGAWEIQVCRQIPIQMEVLGRDREMNQSLKRILLRLAE